MSLSNYTRTENSVISTNLPAAVQQQIAESLAFESDFFSPYELPAFTSNMSYRTRGAVASSTAKTQVTKDTELNEEHHLAYHAITPISPNYYDSGLL
jgi:hypothetical protein